MSDSEAPPIRELIPHRGRSVLLDSVIAHDGESTTVSVIVGSQRWLRQQDGSVASWLAVEYMAQCVAAHESMIARADRRAVPLGFLVSVTGLRLGVPHFRRDEHLSVCVRRVRGRPGLGVLSHAGQIFSVSEGSGSMPVAEGRLSIAMERAKG
jgi:predicted hotdog family 3-hydroxylacyl-ACP dehydratase